MRVSSGRMVGLWRAYAAVAILCVTATAAREPGEEPQNRDRAPVNDAHYSECGTEDEDFPLGSCMLSQECDLLGGTVSGDCAEGLGSCCIVKLSCNSESILNNTYFVNPESDTPGSCDLTINRMNEDICQVRLDFIHFNISQPNNNGHCSDDFFTVTGEMATDVPTICGDNHGQHMYVDVVPDGGALQVVVDLISGTEGRNWNILIQQIACDSRYRAPDGCLQYHTETAGTVESFNFKNGALTDLLATRQLANQNYGVCIKKAAGYCGIIWERDPNSQYGFTLSDFVGGSLPELIGTPSASSTGSLSCQYDFVIIPGGVDDTSVQADRYCGLGFPNDVTSTHAPFVLFVDTDDNETPDGGNVGFKLNYRQTTDC